MTAPGLKYMLMWPLCTVECLCMLGCTLSVQVGEWIALIDIDLSIFLGQLWIFASCLTCYCIEKYLSVSYIIIILIMTITIIRCIYCTTYQLQTRASRPRNRCRWEWPGSWQKFDFHGRKSEMNRRLARWIHRPWPIRGCIEEVWQPWFATWRE